jgi:hypothetical protein
MELARTNLCKVGITAHLRVSLCEQWGNQAVKNQNKKVERSPESPDFG